MAAQTVFGDRCVCAEEYGEGGRATECADTLRGVRVCWRGEEAWKGCGDVDCWGADTSGRCLVIYESNGDDVRLRVR